jgi:para-aminobenzoate synthetase component 1
MANSKLSEFTEKMNRMSGNGEAFLFIIDYELNTGILIPTRECGSAGIFFDIEGSSNFKKKQISRDIEIIKHTIPYESYLEAFQYIQYQIIKGNSYLVNLTFPTPVDINLNTEEIFQLSEARYKLMYKDEFLVFSPETFVKISKGKISAYPMKGTIDASLENAQELLFKNEKETAEHATIVDLLRNDLSRVASNIVVEKYKYIEKINTSGKNLLQMSSVISGDLPVNYRQKLGNIIIDLLPAGSICGAPKKSTLEIISHAEKNERGFYTGIFGVFDGENLNSGVMIRFIENHNGKLVYRSGGGITAKSNPIEEYQELIDKIYVPVN